MQSEKTKSNPAPISVEEWHSRGKALFGEDQMKWRFVCPSCGHIASTQDWKDAGAPEGAVGYSCVGRWTGATKQIFEKPGPCNYAGGGLFGLNPVNVEYAEGKIIAVFDFAPTQDAPEEPMQVSECQEKTQQKAEGVNHEAIAKGKLRRTTGGKRKAKGSSAPPAA